jgi:hypothetical protein
LKPERWGSLLVQENYQDEKAHDKKNDDDTLFIWAIFRTRKNKLQANSAFKNNG